MREKAVIIDDDRITLKIIEKALTELGLEVLSAEDGMEGLDLIQTQKPFLVISDMLLPKLHGLELCRRIRENDITKDIKIVLMSAVYKGPMFERDINTSGADYFIKKPLDIPELVKLVEESRPEAAGAESDS